MAHYKSVLSVAMSSPVAATVTRVLVAGRINARLAASACCAVLTAEGLTTTPTPKAYERVATKHAVRLHPSANLQRTAPVDTPTSARGVAASVQIRLRRKRLGCDLPPKRLGTYGVSKKARVVRRKFIQSQGARIAVGSVR